MPDGYNEFIELRRWFLNKLKNIDMSDDCKNYEGTFELLLFYPNYFYENSRGNKNDSPILAVIELNCYVIGPGHHYKWSGETIHNAVKACRKDITKWVEEYKNGT